MAYDERNRKNLDKLADNTKAKAYIWYAYLIANEINVLIYETIRTVDQQRKNVANGKSQTMKSYHIVGQAFDFVPVNGKQANWGGYGDPKIKAAIAKAKELGFEWGGDWKGFIDKPHLQYNYRGYGSDTFGKTVQQPTQPVHQESPQSSEFKVGQRVTLQGFATHFATGQEIPESVKNKPYTILQVKPTKVLLKEIMSWVWYVDITPKSAPEQTQPYRVIVPNTAFFQAAALVREYEVRGFKCEGVNLKQYAPYEKPKDGDPYQFVIHTTLDHAKQLVIELQIKGYPLAYGEAK
nr:M15 family metallopeptidase [Bacillus sp. 03113]